LMSPSQLSSIKNSLSPRK